MQVKYSKYFFIFSVIFELIGIILLLFFTKPEIQIFINKHHSTFADFFFKNITYLGTGYFLGLLFLLLIFFSRKDALIVLLSSLLMLGIVSLLKFLIFAERPVSYFQYIFHTDYLFHFVEGVKIHYYGSFPSGHTATAFTLFLLAASLPKTKNKIWQILFFILALLVAYSRMYLMQHFLIDLMFGAIVGIVCVYFSIFIINKFSKKK